MPLLSHNTQRRTWSGNTWSTFTYVYMCVQSKSSSIPLIACNWTGQATSSTTHCMLQMNRRWYMKIILISDINRTWEALQDLKLLLCVCGQKLVKNNSGRLENYSKETFQTGSDVTVNLLNAPNESTLQVQEYNVMTTRAPVMQGLINCGVGLLRKIFNSCRENDIFSDKK